MYGLRSSAERGWICARSFSGLVNRLQSEHVVLHRRRRTLSGMQWVFHYSSRIAFRERMLAMLPSTSVAGTNLCSHRLTGMSPRGRDDPLTPRKSFTGPRSSTHCCAPAAQVRPVARNPSGELLQPELGNAGLGGLSLLDSMYCPLGLAWVEFFSDQLIVWDSLVTAASLNTNQPAEYRVLAHGLTNTETP